MKRQLVLFGIIAVMLLTIPVFASAQYRPYAPYGPYGPTPYVCGYDYWGNPQYCYNGYGYGNYGYSPYYGRHYRHEWREREQREHEGHEHHGDRD